MLSQVSYNAMKGTIVDKVLFNNTIISPTNSA